MPRKSRKLSPTGVYHVMIRGINRGNIFLSDMDRGKFVKILRSVAAPVDAHGDSLEPYCNIYAYCLMDNHVHLLISERTENIGTVMKRIGVSYVNYFNKQHLRIGPLFHDRFRSEPVCDVKYFIQLLHYIHFNPIKANIAISLDDYRWSSWHEYKNEIDKMEICAHEVPFADMAWPNICELVRENCHQAIDETPLDRENKNDVEARTILSQICGETKLKEQPMEIRKKFIVQAIEMGLNKKQLARLTGIPYSTIYHQLKVDKKNRPL